MMAAIYGGLLFSKSIIIKQWIPPLLALLPYSFYN
jgi:uncharacterized membrane protein